VLGIVVSDQAAHCVWRLLLQVSGGDLRKAVTTLQSAVRLGGNKVSRCAHRKAC
jgi:hypothetical protein